MRLRYGAPPLPLDLPEPMKLAAHLSHYALYALMIGMPLIGWGMLSAGGYPIVLYGGIRLPPIAPQSDSLHAMLWNAHFYLAFAFFALILLHIAAALFHALVRRDGVLVSMTGWMSRQQTARRSAMNGGEVRSQRRAPTPDEPAITGSRQSPCGPHPALRGSLADRRACWPGGRV